jgi:hypothetical protein
VDAVRLEQGGHPNTCLEFKTDLNSEKPRLGRFSCTPRQGRGMLSNTHSIATYECRSHDTSKRQARCASISKPCLTKRCHVPCRRSARHSTEGRHMIVGLADGEGHQGTSASLALASLEKRKQLATNLQTASRRCHAPGKPLRQVACHRRQHLVCREACKQCGMPEWAQPLSVTICSLLKSPMAWPQT